MKNVIVTGANGFIGSSLIKKMIGKNIHVLAIDINFDNSKLPESELITTLTVGLDDADVLFESIPNGEYDAFYHLAWCGVNGPDKADPTVQINNVLLAVNCANAAKKHGCGRFLCAGTIAEQSVNSLGNLEKTGGGMMYGVAKQCTRLVIETYCKNIDLKFVWMQFSNIYGPSNKTGNLVSYTVNELLNGREASFGPAAQPYDFVYVDDLLEAVYRLGESEYRSNFYYIGSGSPRLLKEYLNTIGKIYGTPELIRIGARADDGIKYELSMFNNSSLVKDIGEYVTKSFEEGIRITIDAFK